MCPHGVFLGPVRGNRPKQTTAGGGTTEPGRVQECSAVWRDDGAPVRGRRAEGTVVCGLDWGAGGRGRTGMDTGLGRAPHWAQGRSLCPVVRRLGGFWGTEQRVSPAPSGSNAAPPFTACVASALSPSSLPAAVKIKPGVREERRSPHHGRHHRGHPEARPSAGSLLPWQGLGAYGLPAAPPPCLLSGRPGL